MGNFNSLGTEIEEKQNGNTSLKWNQVEKKVSVKREV